MGGAEQAALVRALGDPAFYPHRPARVDHVQTHISHVFLAGPYVYKLKKAVRLPFLDFGTADARRHYCTEEVRLNRRLAPGVYLGVVPITRGRGRLVLGGRGKPVDHVVWMRRLPADRMLPALLARGEVDAWMIDALAKRLAAFHATAPDGPEIAAYAEPAALDALFEENVRELGPFVGTLLAPEDHEIVADFGSRFVRQHVPILRSRLHVGAIREGHGDLHAEHVCYLDAPLPGGDAHPPLAPGLYVFDCIEFSRAFRANDVASEVAFLAMDLEALGHAELARRFVAAYAEAAGDVALDVLLPFYGCHRALVRGKVEAMKSVEPEVDANARAAAAAKAGAHFRLGLRFAWRADGPALLVCCGLSGSGKTTVANALADATGYRLLSSDAIRHARGAPRGPVSYGTGPYTLAARTEVYGAIAARAEQALASGDGVVADATFIRREDRTRLRDAARRAGSPYVFVDCEADRMTIRRRLEARSASAASDARWETFLAQEREREPFADDEPRIVVDTTGTPDATRAAALRALWAWRTAPRHVVRGEDASASL